jgi:hypothetical protein
MNLIVDDDLHGGTWFFFWASLLEKTAGPGRRFGGGAGRSFIINGNIALSGAQQPDAFLAAFRQALAPQ